MNGSFSSSVYSGQGKDYSRYVEVIWTSTNDESNNKSSISWTAYIRSQSSNTSKILYAKNIKIAFGSQSKTFYSSSSHPTKKDEKIGYGTFSFSHQTDGTLSMSASIEASFYSYSKPNSTGTTKITLPNNPVYSLSTQADSGCDISTYKVSSQGSLIQVSNGNNKLCKDDVLKIVVTAKNNYAVNSLLVNNISFASGNTYTVKGNLSITATSKPLSNTVKATDAEIGSVSTITITKYSDLYYHSLRYSFGDLSGYITNDGGVSDAEERYQTTTIPFVVPTTFFNQIPNDKSGKCTITCTTYENESETISIGESTYSITVYAIGTPIFSSVLFGETSLLLSELTGGIDKLIRYRATANLVFNVVPQIGAKISSVTVNGTPASIIDNRPGYPVYAIKSFQNFSEDTIIIQAVDSRGNIAVKTLSKDSDWTTVEYIPLTINPTVKRTADYNKIALSFTGNLFIGSFGVVDNDIAVKYRYRNVSDSGAFSDWVTIPKTSMILSEASQTFSSDGEILLSGEFDYTKEYLFEVVAIDGCPDEETFGIAIEVTTITKQIQVARAIPSFDWGENDFNFNVDIQYQRKSLFNIIYPIGTVYLNINNTLPEDIQLIGTWESIQTGIEAVFGWKRIT